MKWLKHGQGKRGKQVYIAAYDGDTLHSSRAPKGMRKGRVQSTRLMHYNSPEIESVHRKGQPGGQTAKAALHGLLLRGMRVKDSGRTDIHKRRLAEGTLKNAPIGERRSVAARMVSLGLATPHRGSPKYKELNILKKHAQAKDSGMWGGYLP